MTRMKEMGQCELRNMQGLNTKFEEGLKMAEAETGETFAYQPVPFERDASDSAYSEMCAKVRQHHHYNEIIIHLTIIISH